MSLKKGDKAVLKPGGRAEWAARGPSNGRWPSFLIPNIQPDTVFKVNLGPNERGNVQLGIPGTVLGAGLIHRDQLLRRFEGGFTEGDKVMSPALDLYGTVEDYDADRPSDRSLVPVRLEKLSPYANKMLKVGEIALIEQSYLKKRPTIGPLASLPDRLDIQVVGGAGGAGGSAVGAGAVGGRGGNGGSARITVGSGTVWSVDSGRSLTVDNKPEPKRWVNVTDEVKGIWKNVQVGDLVTAEHVTRHFGSSVATINSRTSEVVGGIGLGRQWIDLALDERPTWDGYKITDVKRPARKKLLSERRKPIPLKITREVPRDGIWEPTSRDAVAKGYIEKNLQSNEYWVFFEGGAKARLVAGRDSVQYKAITGSWYATTFQTAQDLTHEPE